MVRRIPFLLALLGALVLAPAAVANPLDDSLNQWLPSDKTITWTYRWSDSEYATKPTREKYTVSAPGRRAFSLAWTTTGLGNGDGTVKSSGTVDYQRTSAGLVNTNWSGTVPPPDFPVLCATASGCGNSIAGSHFLLIWGTRSPVLLEPLVKGTTWSSVGGTNDDVATDNRYLGRSTVKVPAFPNGVRAAKIQSEVTQAGALGDPYGSGVRTVWWVYGVGPVRIDFRHTGGELTHAELEKTTVTARPMPSDTNWFPLKKGSSMRLRWRNSKHMKKWSVQKVTVADAVAGSARLDVKHVSGPIKVAGAYLFTSRLEGLTNTLAKTQAATLAKFPPLGPKAQPKNKRRHFFTPLDLVTYGLNPILGAFPHAGQHWKSFAGSRDQTVYGVTGATRVLGLRTVRTPAGKFRALAVFSRLHQSGFRFGSGTRTSYFAPDKGLVKLVFRHADGSVSTVERLK